MCGDPRVKPEDDWRVLWGRPSYRHSRESGNLIYKKIPDQVEDDSECKEDDDTVGGRMTGMDAFILAIAATGNRK